MSPLGLLTRENPNLLNCPGPGSDPRLSVSDMEWSESENPGGGASARDEGEGHTLGTDTGSDGGGGGTPPNTCTSFRP